MKLRTLKLKSLKQNPAKYHLAKIAKFESTDKVARR